MPAKGKKKPPTQRDFGHTWFLKEWMEQSDPPKRQADLVRDLDWARAKASDIYNGDQQYTQALIDQLAPWLHARPWELLMHPAEAMAIRRLRESAAVIVSAEPKPGSADDIYRRLGGSVTATPPPRKRTAG